MKIRTSFVSNSSSSSFIVNKNSLNKKQEKVVRKVWKTFRTSTKDGYPEPEPTKLFTDYRIYVACNQDDIIELFFKHSIPFCSILHYECEILIFNGTECHFTKTHRGLLIYESEKIMKDPSLFDKLLKIDRRQSLKMQKVYNKEVKEMVKDEK